MNRAERRRQQYQRTGGKYGYTPEGLLIHQMFNRPCLIHWSNGETTEGNWEKDLGEEEGYKYFKDLKESGKPYPIGIELKDNGKGMGNEEQLANWSDVITKCLLKYYDPDIVFD